MKDFIETIADHPALTGAFFSMFIGLFFLGVWGYFYFPMLKKNKVVQSQVDWNLFYLYSWGIGFLAGGLVVLVFIGITPYTDNRSRTKSEIELEEPVAVAAVTHPTTGVWYTNPPKKEEPAYRCTIKEAGEIGVSVVSRQWQERPTYSVISPEYQIVRPVGSFNCTVGRTRMITSVTTNPITGVQQSFGPPTTQRVSFLNQGLFHR